MRNLVIHPQDKSTDFLKPIYKTATGKRVVKKAKNPNTIIELIKKSDRVMMMGHGCSYGLFSMQLFDSFCKSIVINSYETEVLKNQNENVYVWCNADKFVEANDLHGFYSGMFISEVGEASFCGLNGITQETVNESNDTFSRIVGKYINLPKDELHEKVMAEYGELAKTNPVASYNLARLYVR